ncbi:hypothetical protein SARC_00032, partial [Sphaeroforma arctica JP610]
MQQLTLNQQKHTHLNQIRLRSLMLLRRSSIQSQAEIVHAHAEIVDQALIPQISSTSVAILSNDTDNTAALNSSEDVVISNVTNTSFTRLNDPLLQDAGVHASQIQRAESTTSDGPRPDGEILVLYYIESVYDKISKCCKTSATALLEYLNKSMWIRAPNPTLCGLATKK